MFRHESVVAFFAAFCLSGELFAQSRPYVGPDDPAGDIAAERDGYMTGNRVFLKFRNTSELSDWPRPDVSKWPNDQSGVKMLDGVAFMLGARVYIENDSIPVTDPVVIGSRTDLDTLYFLQTSYREEMDRDPTGVIEWGFYPVFGYFNQLFDYPAMSNDPRSWPPNGWPARGDELIWPGEWNGRFGRGVQYADRETYFVVNDAHDQEYLGPEDRVKYYPRPGVKIGDKHPEYCTIQRGKPWGGLGVRVEVRGFQWNNDEARDVIFWEYKIANISDYDLPEVAFGYWVHSSIGGERDDELGSFNVEIDLAYSWDVDGLGAGGLPTGAMGFALLETPALPHDSRDNDDDGLIDEKRDDSATRIVGPQEGIADLEKFLEHYDLTLEELREHWDADEDQDWDDGNDANANGVYDLTEDSGDDVGLDGVAPGDANYTGPDEGECNHRPDFLEGYGCEPDFAITDVSESDMAGLTSFRLLPVPSHNPPYIHWFRNDRSMWELIGQDSLDAYSGNFSNLILTCSSGPFAFHKGREERISMAILHAYEDLAGLNSDLHAAPNLFQLKRTTQRVYENDYRFEDLPPRLMASFYATNASGVPPLAVSFFDLSYVARPGSESQIISWLWNFGDGATGQTQNPEHTYVESGEYDVTLIVQTRSGLIDTLTKEDFVLVNPLAYANQAEYDLTDASLVNGSAWADWDNDGDIDLSIADQLRNFLFLNHSGQRFTEVTEGEIVARGSSSGQSWADCDNDGDLDLLNSARSLLLFKNNNDDTFSKVTLSAESGSAAWVDYDNDGWLDIFATRNAGKSLQYKNNCDGTFSVVSAGSLASDDSSTYAGWADYDNDNDLDLYVTKLFSANALYRNEGNGDFARIDLGESITGVSYTCSWGDYDSDGDLDLFVGNTEADVLYRNNGDGTFTRRTDAGIEMGNPTIASSWGDFNNDGHVDLLLLGFRSNAVYKNKGDGTFERVSLPKPGRQSFSTGSWGDFNFDGRLDLYAAGSGDWEGLYINCGEAKHWIETKCVGSISNKSAIGAKVRVKSLIGGKYVWQMQEISAQTGAHSQNSLEAEFGLGDATLVDSLVIQWPSGAKDSYSNIAADQIIRATENEGWVTQAVNDAPGSSLPARFELLQNYPNPFNPVTRISFRLPHAAQVKLEVYNSLGQLATTLLDKRLPAGTHTVEFDGSRLTSGVYLCRLATQESQQV